LPTIFVEAFLVEDAFLAVGIDTHSDLGHLIRRFNDFLAIPTNHEITSETDDWLKRRSDLSTFQMVLMVQEPMAFAEGLNSLLIVHETQRLIFAPAAVNPRTRPEMTSLDVSRDLSAKSVEIEEIRQTTSTFIPDSFGFFGSDQMD
jgi:hypothetical protein